jgi:hypothetical protein
MGQMTQPLMLTMMMMMMMMMVSHKQAYVSQQLAYLGSDVILPLTLCFGVGAAIGFSRRPTFGKHNYQRLSVQSPRTLLSCPCHV